MRVSRRALAAAYWVPVLAWWAVMLYFSSAPNPYALLDDLAWTPIDSVAHLIGFSVFGLLLAMTLGRTLGRTTRALAWALAVCAIYAVIDELHQIPIPGRGCAWQDMVTDGVGGAIGVALVGCWWWIGGRTAASTGRGG